jgi:hypothetical protein
MTMFFRLDLLFNWRSSINVEVRMRQDGGQLLELPSEPSASERVGGMANAFHEVQ